MIVFDNIVFSLQEVGGISFLWKNMLKYAQSQNIPYKCIEYKGAERNIFRKSLDIAPDILDLRKLVPYFGRYLQPAVINNVDSKFIFHSSYYRYCKHPNALNVTTVHDFTYEKYNHGIRRYIHHKQKSDAIRHSHAIICVSRNTANDLINYYPEIPEKRIHVIHNGISDEFSKGINKPQNNPGNYIFYIGSRDHYKNFKFVLEAVSSTDLDLVVCGKPFDKNEQKLAAPLLRSGKLKVITFPDKDTLVDLYHGAVCLLYPSSYEGFGIPIIEAQKCYCPVIALRSSSIPEIIGDDNLMMKNLSISEFKRCIEYVTSHRQAIVHEGIVNSQRFSLSDTLDQYFSLYKDILSHFN